MVKFRCFVGCKFGVDVEGREVEGLDGKVVFIYRSGGSGL